MPLENTKNRVRGVFKALGAEKVWEKAGGLGFRSLFRKLNRRSMDTVIPPMSAETRQALTKVFAPEIATLESLSGMSFANWLSNESS